MNLRRCFGLALAAAAAVLSLLHFVGRPAEATSSWGCAETVPANATGSCSAAEGKGSHTNNWSIVVMGNSQTMTTGCPIPHGSSGGCGHSNPGWTFTGHSSTHGSHRYKLSWSCNSGYTQKGSGCATTTPPTTTPPTTTPPTTTPAAPTLPVPTAPAITCTVTPSAQTFSAGSPFDGWAKSPPTGWDREAEHQARYRHDSGAWKSLTVTDHSSGFVTVASGPSASGAAVELQVRARGRVKQSGSGSWSAWSTWSTWSASSSAQCPSLVKSATPATPSNASVSCSGGTATVGFSGLATATQLSETRYFAVWLKGLYGGSPVLTESPVPSGGGLPAAATATLTLTVGTDLDSSADLTSLRVYSEQRTRSSAADAWDLWSARSAPSEAPKHTGGCWAGSGS